MAMDRELSFEFYPPKTEKGLLVLLQVAQSLALLDPAYCSVTFGAGGSTQFKTAETVLALQQKVTAPIVPHISCVNNTPEQLLMMLDQHKHNQVRRLVVLRGDEPANSPSSTKDLAHAVDLVELIRQRYADYFDIAVACYPEGHPQASDLEKDFSYFVDKVKAGANRAITQYFYNIEAYERFMERCTRAGLTIPIIPGIMPIQNLENLQRFSDRCGADLPRWLWQELSVYKEQPESMRKKAIEIVTRLSERLLQAGAPGLHFYTLNHAAMTTEIVKNCRSLGYQFTNKHRSAQSL